MTLSDLQRLHDAATPGEWTAARSGHFIMNGHECIASFVNCDGNTHANRALVIAMHANFGALLSLARAAQRLQVARRDGHGDPSVDMLSDELDAALVVLGKGGT